MARYFCPVPENLDGEHRRLRPAYIIIACGARIQKAKSRCMRDRSPGTRVWSSVEHRYRFRLDKRYYCSDREIIGANQGLGFSRSVRHVSCDTGGFVPWRRLRPLADIEGLVGVSSLCVVSFVRHTRDRCHRQERNPFVAVERIGDKRLPRLWSLSRRPRAAVLVFPWGLPP